MYGDLMIELLSETESEMWTVREISVTVVSEHSVLFCMCVRHER